jgi:hypothetical protein
MEKEGEGEGEQRELAEPGRDRAMRSSICPRTRGSGHQPGNEANRPDAQNDTCDPIRD